MSALLNRKPVLWFGAGPRTRRARRVIARPSCLASRRSTSPLSKEDPKNQRHEALKITPSPSAPDFRDRLRSWRHGNLI